LFSLEKIRLLKTFHQRFHQIVTPRLNCYRHHMNRWPYRPTTLIARLELALIRLHGLTDDDDVESWFQANRDLELARRDLLARIEPATPYHRKHR
jgi:hypothetical protein